MVVADQAEIVPAAPSDRVVAVSTADLLERAAAPDYEVGIRATFDRVVTAVAAHDAHGSALVVTPYRVRSSAAVDRVVPAGRGELVRLQRLVLDYRTGELVVRCLYRSQDWPQWRPAA